MGYGDDILVNHGGVAEGAENLRTAAKNIANRLETLENDLEKTFGENWSGESFQAYLRAKIKWDGAIREMLLLLEQTGMNLDRNNEDWKVLDDKSAAMFRD